MNGRSAIATFFLFLFLACVILLQILSMVQSDRLYERLNRLIESRQSMRPVRVVEETGPKTALPGEEYPGDEGDWLIFHLDSEPATLTNMHASAGVPCLYIVFKNIFESLTRYGMDSFEQELELAESFEVSEDGLEIHFKIRDDAVFSDGKPVTADDVIFTYSTIMNPKIDARDLASYYQNVDHIEKISDKEVKFYMKEVYFRSLDIVGGMDIYPKHIYRFDDPSEFNNHISNPVGSGPYIFEKWDVGNQVVLRRNDNYWGRKPKINKIVYRFITNNRAAVQALRAGDIDFMEPEPDQFRDLCEDETFTKDINCLSYWHPGVGYFWIGWNQDKPFFKDRRVRLAMTHLVDREKICKYLLDDSDAIVPTGPFYINGPQCDKSIKPWPYDPERAKELLDEAGWVDTDGDGIRDKDGVPFRFKYMIGTVFLHERISKLIKDEASKVGIDIQIDPYEWSVFVQRVQDRQFDVVNMAWKAGLAGDPYQVWHSSQIGNRGSNYIGFNNPEADALIEEARRTLDDGKRNALFHEFHRLLHEEQPYTFVYTRPGKRFLHKRFHNVKIHLLGINGFEWYVPRHLQKYK